MVSDTGDSKVHLSDPAPTSPWRSHHRALRKPHPCNHRDLCCRRNPTCVFPTPWNPVGCHSNQTGLRAKFRPWRPTRLPVFSSLSLELLPERAATLMVYEDLIHINSGSQGSRGQSWVQFQRRALSLPLNSSYSNLTALLTVANNPSHIQHFPYLQGLGGNGTGTSTGTGTDWDQT
ncbi:protein FAM171A1-like [Salvelinus sp. IW2-2015]|uniref:protein FAM171A1-like n=1 Tax=Salvelinus sp. IW2-2015 TaxID=2691554 RepID=UPI000CEACF39|nr:protein FAM171A1-like [Salvelinus alpinus]